MNTDQYNDKFDDSFQDFQSKSQALIPHNAINKTLWDKICYLRNLPQKESKNRKQNFLKKPVAVFSKEERLKNEMGMEITLIFRSIACSWARSKSGGCTMCGYINDRADDALTSEDLWDQFQFALQKYKDLIEDPTQKIVFKMFTSGSYCDPQEFPEDLQLKILETLCTYPTIVEIVIESRPSYLTHALLEKYASIISTQYLEIAIGLESSDDYIRENLLNKGFNTQLFIDKLKLLHSFHFGAKAYLLFKPPFLSEMAAMYDLLRSFRQCVRWGVDTISINPTNIQAHTIVEELYKTNRFRPPWLFSLIWLLKHGITQDELKQTRIICDPSAAGKFRGVHNCHEKDPSNDEYLKILHNFVSTQDLTVLPEKIPCDSACSIEYLAELFF